MLRDSQRLRFGVERGSENVFGASDLLGNRRAPRRELGGDCARPHHCVDVIHK